MDLNESIVILGKQKFNYNQFLFILNFNTGMQTSIWERYNPIVLEVCIELIKTLNSLLIYY